MIVTAEANLPFARVDPSAMMVLMAGDGCGESSGAPQPVDPAFCLSMDRWADLVGFAQATGVRLIFGLNAMTFRPNNSAPLNLTNIEGFLAHTAAAGLPVAGFELGNELPNVPPAVNADDFLRLAALLAQYWPAKAMRPMLVGNDLNSNEGYVRQWLPMVADSLDALTYHNYVAEGGSIPVDDFMSPTYLNKGPQQSAGVIEAWRTLAAGRGVQLWTGEIAACWHSGQQNWTDRFGDAFWCVRCCGCSSPAEHSLAAAASAGLVVRACLT